MQAIDLIQGIKHAIALYKNLDLLCDILLLSKIHLWDAQSAHIKKEGIKQLYNRTRFMSFNLQSQYILRN